MLDMSWGEIMVISGVALVVIGPKDLPKALRTVGQMTAKVRRMAGEFQSQFSEAMREAELDEVRREVDGINRSVSSATAGSFNPIQSIRDELKGAVDGKATGAAGATTASATDWTAGQSDVTLSPVVDPAPPVALEPLPYTPLPEPLDPETAPLVPVPTPLSTAEPMPPPPPADSDADRLLTGPGLEPATAPELRKAEHA